MSSNPIPTAGVLIIENNKVLLVKPRPHSIYKNVKYGIPAGKVIVREPEMVAAIRKLKEETGLDVSANNLMPIDKTWEAVIDRGTEIVNMKLKVFIAKEYLGDLDVGGYMSPEWIDVPRISKLDLMPNIEDVVNEGLKYS